MIKTNDALTKNRAAINKLLLAEGKLLHNRAHLFAAYDKSRQPLLADLITNCRASGISAAAAIQSIHEHPGT